MRVHPQVNAGGSVELMFASESALGSSMLTDNLQSVIRFVNHSLQQKMMSEVELLREMMTSQEGHLNAVHPC